MYQVGNLDEEQSDHFTVQGVNFIVHNLNSRVRADGYRCRHLRCTGRSKLDSKVITVRTTEDVKVELLSCVLVS